MGQVPSIRVHHSHNRVHVSVGREFLPRRVRRTRRGIGRCRGRKVNYVAAAGATPALPRWMAKTSATASRCLDVCGVGRSGATLRAPWYS